MSRKLSAGEQMLIRFAEMWAEEHGGEEYIIVWGGKDSKAASDLAHSGISMDSFIARVKVYFKNKKWYELCQHSFTAFVYNVNKFIPERPKPTVQPVQSEFEVDTSGHQVRRGKICEVCFPKCNNCGQNHAVKVPCDEHAQLMSWAARIVTEGEKKRGGGLKPIGDL